MSNTVNETTTTKDSTQKTTQQPYAVAVIFSSWPLGQVCAFLEDELGANQSQIGFMRIDRFKGKETNRTLLLLDRTLLDAAESRGFTRQQRGLDFKMAEYELRENSFPKEGYTRNFYIPLPNTVTADEARAQLQNKLDVLCEFGVFSKDQTPRLKIPLKSRETGEHRGQAFVTFARETADVPIALSRVLLHETRLYKSDTEFERMQCFWAKVNDNKKLDKSNSSRSDSSNLDSNPKKKKFQKRNVRKSAPPKKSLTRTQTSGNVVSINHESGEPQVENPVQTESDPCVPFKTSDCTANPTTNPTTGCGTCIRANEDSCSVPSDGCVPSDSTGPCLTESTNSL